MKSSAWKIFLVKLQMKSKQRKMWISYGNTIAVAIILNSRPASASFIQACFAGTAAVIGC